MAGSIREPVRRIVLVGENGTGKSATGNTILGRKVFMSEWTPWSLTVECQKEKAQLNGRKVVVVDTPGFDHNSPSNEYTVAEVRSCVKICSPGPHVILHVMHPLCSSKKEMKMAQLIKEMFGLKAKDYTILLVTHKNYLEDKSVANFIYSRDENVKKYIAECGNRCLAFDNKAKRAEREAQVAELMTMIDALVETNRNAPCYRADMMKFK